MKTNENQLLQNEESTSATNEKTSVENLLLFIRLKTFEKLNSLSFQLYAVLFNVKKRSLLAMVLLLGLNLTAQESAINSKPLATILTIDTKGINETPVQMASMVRVELEKLNLFQVMDIYDVNYMAEKNKININNCYGKMCLVEVGKLIKSDKMFTGSVEQIGKNIIITFRLIDVTTGSIEKSHVEEFLNLPNDLQSMVKIAMAKMFGKEPPAEPIQKSLSQKNSFEDATNNPEQSKVNLSGPRMGFVYFTGEAGKVLQLPKDKGGYNSYPVLFQFGYKFEVQYLNEGNNQALFEFLPMLTGFNQNIFIPSITIMNGFRNNKYGWEIAFGPTFTVVRKADGYYDSNGDWYLKNDWKDNSQINPYKIEQRIDSRGEIEFMAGFIIAAGKTFKSGKLNVPVNAYIIPNKDGLKVGVSFGFNAKRR